MSQPIQPPAVPEAPDVVAARALAALVVMLHTDPLAACLLGGPVYDRPFYGVNAGEVQVRYHGDRNGAERLAAARALFGGTVKTGNAYGTNETHELTTTWCGVPLKVAVKIPREDELEAARKRIAELEAEAHRQALLEEQRHQLLDDVAPDPAAYIASVTS